MIEIRERESIRENRQYTNLKMPLVGDLVGALCLDLGRIILETLSLSEHISCICIIYLHISYVRICVLDPLHGVYNYSDEYYDFPDLLKTQPTS